MAVTRTPILSQGTAAGPSALVTIDAGQTVGVGLFVASGRIPAGTCEITLKTSGANAAYDDSDAGTPFGLDRGNVVRHFKGPLELYVTRPAGMDVGIEKIT